MGGYKKLFIFPWIIQSFKSDLIESADFTNDGYQHGLDIVCDINQKFESFKNLSHSTEGRNNLLLLKLVSLIESNYGNLGCTDNMFGVDDSLYEQAKRADTQNSYKKDLRVLQQQLQNYKERMKCSQFKLVSINFHLKM